MLMKDTADSTVAANADLQEIAAAPPALGDQRSRPLSILEANVGQPLPLALNPDAPHLWPSSVGPAITRTAQDLRVAKCLPQRSGCRWVAEGTHGDMPRLVGPCPAAPRKQATKRA
jgi:hypothetical protein